MQNIKKTFDAITFISLCVMAFSLPFSKSMLEICFIVALVSWILGKGLSLKPVKTPLNLPLYLFAFIAFLSVLVSPSISLSLTALFSKTLKMIMLYFIIVEAVDTRKKVTVLLTTFFFAVVITGADVIYQLIRGVDLIRRCSMMGDRITGPFLNPNYMAAWLTVAVPLLSCFLNFACKNLTKKTKYLLFVLEAVLIISLLLTYTRGAWIAVVLSLVLTGIFKSRRLALITIVVATLLFFFSTKSVRERVVSIVTNSSSHKAVLWQEVASVKERVVSIVTSSNPHRAMLWREAISIIKDFPVLGCGLNTYSIVAPKYKIAEGGGIYPHNSYLQMAAETGLLELGAFLWIMVTLFRTSWRNLKIIFNQVKRADFTDTNSVGLNDNALLIGLLAGLLAFLIHSFFDNNLYSLGLKYLMWLVIGLIVAIQRVALKEIIQPG